MCERGEGCGCGAWHGLADGQEEGEEVVDEFVVGWEGEGREEGVCEGLEEARLVQEVC